MQVKELMTILALVNPNMEVKAENECGEWSLRTDDILYNEDKTALHIGYMHCPYRFHKVVKD